MRAARLVSVLGVFAALGGLLGAASLVWGQVIGLGMESTPRDLDSLPQLVSFQQSGDATMTVLDLPVWLRALCATPGLVEAVAWAIAAFLLVAVLVSIGEGDSFGGLVQRNLRRIALVLLVGSIAVPLIDALAIWQVQAAIWRFADAASESGITWTTGYGQDLPAIPWLALALGLVAAALRWAVQDGAALEKAAEGVV